MRLIACYNYFHCYNVCGVINVSHVSGIHLHLMVHEYMFLELLPFYVIDLI